MKFSEYEKKNPKKIKKNDWIDDYDFEVCHLVSEARLYAGLTQKQLARRMKTQQPSIARVENGLALPGHDFLKRMASAIGVPLLAPRFDSMEPIKNGNASFNSGASEKWMLSELENIFMRPISVSLTSN